MTKTTFYCDQCHKEITNGMAFSGTILAAEGSDGPKLTVSVSCSILADCAPADSVWCGWGCAKNAMDAEMSCLWKLLELRGYHERQS